MLDANNYNSSCQFADDLVSFLYGELTGNTKAKFEKHLERCSFCNQELAAFGAIRNSISDWKEKDFTNLSIPEIILPIEEKTHALVENKTQNRSWFVSISEIFTLSPAWNLAAAACAALLICIGLIFVAVSSRDDSGSEVVQKQPTQTLPVNVGNNNSSPTGNVSDTSGKDKLIQPIEPPKEIADVKKPANDVKKSLPTVDSKQTQPKAKVVPVSNPAVKKNEPPKVETPRKNNVKPNNLPNLQSDDEEDDSPRLSDLFDEIGAETK